MNDLTRQGVMAARADNPYLARQLFIAATESDKDDIVAWWWLARIIDDPKDRRKCLDKARAVGAGSEEGRGIYGELLRESGAPSLPRYKLGNKSRSVGDKCPICTEEMTAKEEVVICPVCNRANHSECWEYNVFHCGNFKCDGSALVDLTGAIRTEAGAKTETISLHQSEIPAERVWKNRDEQEGEFVTRLKQHAERAMLMRRLQEMFVEGLEERALLAQLEMLQQALGRRVRKAAVVGLLLGVALAYLTFPYSRSWVMALFTIYLAVLCVASAGRHSFLESSPVISVLYWILPSVLAALVMWAAFGLWGIGFAAALVSFITVLIVGRILRTEAIHDRRTFVACSVWLLLVLIIYMRPGLLPFR